MFPLQLKQNELVEEEEEEEAGEEVGFHHGLSTTEAAIWKYIFQLFNQCNGVQYTTVLIISSLLWFGQQVVTEDEEAKALVGTEDGSSIQPVVARLWLSRNKI